VTIQRPQAVLLEVLDTNPHVNLAVAISSTLSETSAVDALVAPVQLRRVQVFSEARCELTDPTTRPYFIFSIRCIGVVVARRFDPSIPDEC
jgi:hypothetical protein